MSHFETRKTAMQQQYIKCIFIKERAMCICLISYLFGFLLSLFKHFSYLPNTGWPISEPTIGFRDIKPIIYLSKKATHYGLKIDIFYLQSF
jgi:hypothetical protein